MEPPKRRILRIMQAFILAGGLGSRLGATHTPKPLYRVPENGPTVLDHILHHLVDQGVKRIIISTGFLSLAIKDHIRDEFRGIRIEYVDAQADIKDSILAARPLLKSPFIFAWADIITDVNLNEMGKPLKGKIMRIMAKQLNDTHQYGKLSRKENKWEFITQERNDGSSGLIDAGVHYCSPKFFEVLEGAKGLGPAKRWLAASDKLEVYEHKGIWLEIGTPERYKAACDYFKNKA